VIRKPDKIGDTIHPKLMTVRYIPLVFPTVFGVPKCSMNISIQNNTSVFVVTKHINAIAIKSGLFVDIRVAKEAIFTRININTSFLLPKYLRMVDVLDNNSSVKIDAIVYNIPT